jgi:hypothetical protein
VRWDGPAGARFACAPYLRDDVVLCVRGDGVLEALQADNGTMVARASLDGPVISAWTTDHGLAGLTAQSCWDWNGSELNRTQLPRQAVAGNERIFLTSDKRAFVLVEEDTWKELGQFSGTPSAEPLVWAGHAVVPAGNTLHVLGAEGFSITTAAGEFLAPTAFGSDLVAVASDGEVWIYSE